MKPIYIPWDDLTEDLWGMAVEAIRGVVLEEIKERRGRVRLELNEIPGELYTALAELVGVDNPDFEWVQVDMDVG